MTRKNKFPLFSENFRIVFLMVEYYNDFSAEGIRVQKFFDLYDHEFVELLS